MEELRKELDYEKYVLCKLVSMAERMGNRDYRSTPLIQQQMAYVKKLEAALKAKQEVACE